jgi:chloramphenicol O-acetyltransferase type B
MYRVIKSEELKNQSQYRWFKTFRNSTYCMNVKMDVTSIVTRAYERKESFFILMLYAVLKGLNSVDAMRMRIEDGKPVIYDVINPSFTVMTQSGDFTNVRFTNVEDFDKFYSTAKEVIEQAKVSKVDNENYNLESIHNEYYMTCVPWVDFEGMTHPVPDEIESQVVPRICWGKYVENNGRYALTLNINVSHIFVDGYPLSCAFKNIQECIDELGK